MEFILSVVISVFTGVLSSFFVWWLLFHKIVPKIEFGPSICKSRRTHLSCGYVYRFKYVNKGRRDIIDVEFVLRLRIKGLYKGKPNLSEFYYLKTGSGVNNRIPIIPAFHRSKSRYMSQISYIKNTAFKKQKFPLEIRKNAEEGLLLLDDLMKLGTKCEFQIILFGNDAFSGTRKCFFSKKYTVDDIVEGEFDSKSLLVKPYNDSEIRNEN